MEEEKKYLDYKGLQTYHTNLCNIIEDNEQVTAAALDDLDDRLEDIENKDPYSKLEIDNLLEPITDKLDDIEEFAEVNVLSDWNQTDTTADDYIKNKPTIPSQYELPIASANTLGGVKVGDNLSIDQNGVLSAESVEVVQTTGNSTTAVMSLDAVTNIITENEEIVSTALNDLNNRVESLEENPGVEVVQTTGSSTTDVMSLKAVSDHITNHTHASSAVTAMTGYEKAANGTPITSADTLNQAIGKLEKMIDELKDYIEQKELAIAAALTDLDNRLKAIE